MQIIASGSPRAQFTMSPRYEAQRLAGMQPAPSRAIVASFHGLQGLAGEMTPEERAAFADDVYARIMRGGGMPVKQEPVPWGLIAGFSAFITFAIWMAFKK